MGTGTFSTLGFFALAIGDFKLGRRLCNLSLKLMKVNALKDKICMAFIFIKGLLNPWLYYVRYDIRDRISDLKLNFARCLKEGRVIPNMRTTVSAIILCTALNREKFSITFIRK